MYRKKKSLKNQTAKLYEWNKRWQYWNSLNVTVKKYISFEIVKNVSITNIDISVFPDIKYIFQILVCPAWVLNEIWIPSFPD